jgi:hypothetical protein
MTARFIVRLLDSAGTLLSWVEVYAASKVQERAGSCPFWPIAPTQFVIDQDGLASQISVHWADLDVARVCAPLEAVPVKAGEVFTYTWIEPVWLVPGMRDVPLPQVTVNKPVVIGVPVGALVARA